MTSRRDLCFSLPALALFGEALASAQCETGSNQQATAELNHCKVFRSQDYPVTSTAFGTSQNIVHGTLPLGEGFEMHKTVLNPGKTTHPPHKHLHDELMLLCEGDHVEFFTNGSWQSAQAGDILYARSMELHGIRNTGKKPAQYFVIAIGPDVKNGIPPA